MSYDMQGSGDMAFAVIAFMFLTLFAIAVVAILFALG